MPGAQKAIPETTVKVVERPRRIGGPVFLASLGAARLAHAHGRDAIERESLEALRRMGRIGVAIFVHDGPSGRSRRVLRIHDGPAAQ